DTELLRVSAVWRGDGVTMRSASQVSYHDAGRKAADGQADLPKPSGTVVLTNGLYPGWQTGKRISPRAPRELAPSPEEVGRGPLHAEQGRFVALRRTKAGICLEYLIAGVRIEEIMTGAAIGDRVSFQRTFRVGPTEVPLLLVAARKEDSDHELRISVFDGT